MKTYMAFLLQKTWFNLKQIAILLLNAFLDYVLCLYYHKKVHKNPQVEYCNFHTLPNDRMYHIHYIIHVIDSV